LRKQRVARKRLGVQSGKFSDANEETWCDPIWATEVKSGRQVMPAVRAWERAVAQIEAGQVLGRPRAPRVVLMPPGWGDDGLVIVRLSDWEKHLNG
jgi:hypothetical protein